MGIVNKTYGELITHSRNSASSRWNEFGKFEIVAANQPCIDHDPASLGESTSAVEIGLGDKTFATSTVYAVGDVVQASVSSGVFVRGRVKSSVAGSLTINVVRTGGSGTYSNWTLIRVRGLGVWEHRTNLIPYSNEFGNSTWVKSNATPVRAALSPSGNFDFWKIEETPVNTIHTLHCSFAASNGQYVLSVFAKAAERKWLVLLNTLGTTKPGFNQRVWFDLANGVVGQVDAGYTAGILHVGGGVYHCWISANFTGVSSALSFMIGTAPANGVISHQGVAGSGVLVYEAGCQQGSFPIPHIPTPATFVSRAGAATYFDQNGVLQTAAANVARDQHHVLIDGAWRKAGLLLEGQATNLLQNSAAAGAVAGSPGVLPTGWAISQTPNNSTVSVVGVGVESGIPYVDIRVAGTPATTNAFLLNLGTTTVAAGQHTLSAYIKLVAGGLPSNIGLSGNTESGANFVGIQAGANITRAQASWNLAGGSLTPWVHIPSVVGKAMDYTIRVGLPQLETGPVATSTIITNGSQVTRAADVSTSAQVTRAGDPPHVPISSQWFNPGTEVLGAELYAYSKVGAMAGSSVLSPLSNGFQFNGSGQLSDYGQRSFINFTTISGRTYRVSLRITSDDMTASGSGFFVRQGSDGGGTILYSNTSVTAGVKTFVFVATGAASTILFDSNKDNSIYTVTDISIRELSNASQEGCVYVEFECDGSRNSVTAHNAFAIKNSSPGALLIRAIRGSVDKYPVGVFSQAGQLTAATAIATQTGRERTVISWKGGAGKFARNGQLSTGFSLDPIQAQLLALGVSDSLNVHYLNGWISDLRYYRQRLTDTQLQQLSATGELN